MRDDRSGVGTGVVLITVGLLFMADRQGYASFSRLWPMILIVLGAVTLLFPKSSCDVGVVAGRRGSARRERSRVSGGLWMLFVGVLLLANQNHWMAFSQSWPLFIVAGGLALIFGGLSQRAQVSSAHDTTGTNSHTDAESGGQWR